MVKTLQKYGQLLDKQIAYYKRKMNDKKLFKHKNDEKFSKEEIEYIIFGLEQAKDILVGYVMLPED